MTDVFISYKREDEPRVAPIVEGLRTAGLSVWWDRDISGGESWRNTITERLDAARCVLVVWSGISVTAAGEFVHEEAGRAKARGALLPVRIDQVTEPIGFGQIQSLDLVGWRGNPGDRRFKNVVAAAQAVVAGQPRPKPVPPGRVARLAAGWGGGFAIVAGVLGFAADLAGFQALACRIPGVHSVCASIGMGGVPTAAEEALWTARQPGDCEGLKTYLREFPEGAYATEAERRLQAAETHQKVRWLPQVQPLSQVVRSGLDPFADEAAARKDALARGEEEAAMLCRPFEAGGQYRLSSPASTEVRTWRCMRLGGGTVCGYDGDALCKLEARQETQVQSCP